MPRSVRERTCLWGFQGSASQRSSRPADQARVALDSETQGVEAADQQRVAAVDVTVSAIAAPGRGVPTVATIPTGGIGTNAVATRRAGLRIAGRRHNADTRIREAPGNTARVIATARIDDDVVTESIPGGDVTDGDVAGRGGNSIGDVVHRGKPTITTITTITTPRGCIAPFAGFALRIGADRKEVDAALLASDRERRLRRRLVAAQRQRPQRQSEDQGESQPVPACPTHPVSFRPIVQNLRGAHRGDTQGGYLSHPR